MAKRQWEPAMISRYRTEIMGIAILWIVLFHSAIPAPDNGVLRLIWYGAVSFGGGLGVNLFVALSGFGLMYSHSKNSCCRDRRALMHYFSRRLKRIFVLYLPVAAVYFASRAIYNGTGVLGFAEDITLLSFLTKGDRTYWYIFAILLLYCLYPLYMYVSDRWGQGKTCAITVAGIVLFELITCAYLPAFYQKLEIVILRSPLFFIGSYLGSLVLQKPERFKPKGLFAGMTVLALVCLGVYGVFFLKGSASLRLQRYLFIPVSLGLIVALSYMADKLSFLNRVWRICGRNSLGIYLLHIPLYALAGILIKDWNPYVVFLCVTLASVLGAEVLSKVIGRKAVQ